MFKGSHPRDRSPSLHCPGRPLGRGDRLRSHDVRNIHCRNRHRRTTGRHHTFNFCYLEQAYFLPVLKNSEQKKTSPEKNSRQILAKNSHYQGPILIDFEARIRFIKHYFGKMSWILGKTESFWQKNSMILRKNSMQWSQVTVRFHKSGKK